MAIARPSTTTKIDTSRNRPCNDCDRWDECREGKACKAFARWLLNGSVQKTKTKPNRAIFNNIYGQDS